MAINFFQNSLISRKIKHESLEDGEVGSIPTETNRKVYLEVML